MRTLIYVPIIHAVADMGSLGKELSKKYVSAYGEDVWKKHAETVNSYWEAIEHYFETTDLDIKGVKIYQDGMFADDEIGMKIINEGIKSGSKNSEIILKLMNRGATLIKTEDFKMVKAEYDGIQSVVQAKNIIKKLIMLFKYKISKSGFLKRRDKFIAGRINETLGQNETGILFIGAYHNIIKRLAKDITIFELKEIAKVRKYQKGIQIYSTIKTPQFEELIQYMVKK